MGHETITTRPAAHLLGSRLLLLLCAVLALGLPASTSEAEDAKAKPDFALRDTDGVTRRLSDYRGKWVVLEWTNFACASVREHYQAPSRTVPSLQRAFRAKGVVWLSINSTGAGQRGFVTGPQGKAALARMGAAPTALLLDPTGAVGKAFRAQVTPEVRVLSPRGDVVYAGGVHSAGPGARTPYLQSVLTAATSRQAIPFAAKPAQGTLIAYAAARAVATGPKARGFTLPDNTGATRRLSDFRGKWVILEWVNYDCPFVQANYHPSRRIIQTLQAQSAKQGIVWLSICSSARGKQGQFSAAQVNARMKRIGAAPTAYLHDLTGAVGRAYGAGYTPEIRIISPQGTIEYAGGVTGNRRRGRNAAPPRNHLAAAIADVVAGRPIAVKKTETFGCSVKY